MKHTKKSDRELLYKLFHLLIDKRRYFRSGLCGFINNLYIAKQITGKQRSRLVRIIDRNAPIHFFDYPYYFIKGDHQARVDFIVKLIIKYSTPARRK